MATERKWLMVRLDSKGQVYEQRVMTMQERMEASSQWITHGPCCDHGHTDCSPMLHVSCKCGDECS